MLENTQVSNKNLDNLKLSKAFEYRKSPVLDIAKKSFDQDD